MPIEFPCSGCGDELRVGDEYAGKKARCPDCNALTRVPLASVRPAARPASDDEELPTGEVTAVVEENPYSATNLEADDGKTAPPAGPRRRARTRTLEPHRGASILLLGLMSPVLCGAITGIPAVIMGLRDLRAMNIGMMDPRGRGTTVAGMLLGFLGILISLVLFFFQLIRMGA